jgi:hypothetical protein
MCGGTPLLLSDSVPLSRELFFFRTMCVLLLNLARPLLLYLLPSAPLNAAAAHAAGSAGKLEIHRLHQFCVHV